MQEDRGSSTRPLLLIAGLAAAAAPAAARTPRVPAPSSSTPPSTRSALRLPYTGDPTATRPPVSNGGPPGAPPGHRGVAMTRINNARWAAQRPVAPADPPYEVRAVITDPDGGGDRPPAAPAPARTRLPAGAAGRLWVATNGNDGNTGSSTSPFRTIRPRRISPSPATRCACARDLLRDARHAAQRNRERADPLVADGPGVILDGCDPAFLNRSDWRSEGGGVYSLAYTGTTGWSSPTARSGSTTREASRRSRPAPTAWRRAGWSKADGSTCGSRTARRRTAADPRRALRRRRAASTPRYWQIRGLEIRYFGSTSNSAGISVMAGSDCDGSAATTSTRSAARTSSCADRRGDNLIDAISAATPRIDLAVGCGQGPRGGAAGHLAPRRPRQ